VRLFSDLDNAASAFTSGFQAQSVARETWQPSTAACVAPFLRVLGIDITFSREGRAGSRIIRMRALSNIPSAPSAPSATLGPASVHPPPPSPPDICEDNRRPDLVGFWPVAQVPIATTDDADGADANAALRGGTAADCGRDLCERPPEAMPGSSG